MNDASGHITTEANWREWKRACAADLCGEDHAARLRRFGALRFGSMLVRVAADASRSLADSANGWHLLETYARVSSTRAGKRYKDWLFARADLHADGWLESIESGASLLMRDVVRHYLRAESSPSFMVSLHRRIDRDIEAGVTDHGLSLEDLLPGEMDPLDEIEQREWDELAAATARNIHSSMSLKEKAAVWARANGVPLSDQRVKNAAGCSRSELYAAYGDLVARIAQSLKRDHPHEEPARLIQGARQVLAQLENVIAKEKSAENSPSHSFAFV